MYIAATVSTTTYPCNDIELGFKLNLQKRARARENRIK